MPSPTELYKDKIEVSLDGRQIFYLFFGGAVVVGLVFVLGVLVGRRVEARGHIDRAQTQAAADPLAALDRLEGPGGLSFQEQLTGSGAEAPVDKQIAALEKQRKPESATKVEPPAKEAKKLEEPKKADEPKKVEEPKVVAKAEPIEVKPVVEPVAKVEEKKKEEEKKVRYTLQLSSFQDKAEAQSFLDRIRASGYSEVKMTEADVDGKTYYRVRLGTYKSMETATNAKTDYEKSTKKTASIMKM